MSKGGVLQYQFARLNIAEKLIVINVLVFIAQGLLKVLLGLQIEPWFRVPKDFFEFLQQPWSIITYGFLHDGFLHILFNMLWLYFAGRMILNLFDSNRFLTVYFVGVILGGVIFLAAYNVLPELIKSGTPGMVGASAGVMATIIFICAYIPNQDIRFFTFNIKLWHIGLVFVLLDLLQISGNNNVGGSLAHLAGAAWGYTYARQLLKGNDIGGWFTRFHQSIGNAFKPREKKSKLKTVYRKKGKSSAKKQGYSKSKVEDSKQQRIDTILDKISKSGYDSLTKAEKDFLFKAGKDD